MTVKGAFLAASVAGLFAAGTATLARADKTGGVQCEGVNACKGQGGCKSVKNDCKGHNGCKGQGWMPAASKKECEGKGGKVTAAAK